MNDRQIWLGVLMDDTLLVREGTTYLEDGTPIEHTISVQSRVIDTSLLFVQSVVQRFRRHDCFREQQDLDIMAVIIFGSINMDLVVKTPRFPQPGETLGRAHFFYGAWWKGGESGGCRRESWVFRRKMVGQSWQRRVWGNTFGELA